MINNFICVDCKKSNVCKWVGLLDKFSDEKKDPVGVAITVDSCQEFEKFGGDAQ